MKIPVIFATDKDYIDQLGVAVTSLLYNAKKDTFYEVYILHNNSREKLEEKINLIKSINYNNESFKQANFTYIDMSQNTKINNLSCYNHLKNTKGWAYRLIIGELEELKEWEKVIYIDSDTIIDSDLEDLYKIDLEGKALGAVSEYKILVIHAFNFIFSHMQLEYWEKVLKISKEKLKYYFNSGVLLINTKYWKENNFYEKAIYYINKYSENVIYKGNQYYKFLMDQDALNYLCLKDEVKVKPLDMSWNFLTYPMLNIQDTSEKDDYYNFLSHLLLIKDNSNFKEKIIHYASPVKPWLNNMSKYNNLISHYQKIYDKYRELSGWKKKINLKRILYKIKEFFKNLIVFKPKITFVFIMLLIISNLILIVKLLT